MIPTQTTNFVELFALADQYQFARLRLAAFNAARKTVSATSVLRMAQEAQRFRAEDISLMLLSYARTRKCPADIFRELAILYVTGSKASALFGQDSEVPLEAPLDLQYRDSDGSN